MNELKPCPFCGGKARWRYQKPIGWVMCKKCGASSATVSDNYEEADCQQEAITAWNSRVILDGCENELIVRCKDCKHYNTIGCSKGFGWCENIDSERRDIMIDREYGKFVLVCDICGEEIDGFDTFDDALDYSREEGWESKRGEQLDLKDGWVDICPKCQMQLY